MADISLINKADIAGNYGETSTPITFSSNDVTTTIVQGLTITKVADKTYWVDGPLTYTITVTNNSGNTLTNAVVTDSLNTTLVNFNTAYGVEVDDAPTSDFTYNSGTLTVNLKDLAGDATTKITFQVVRVN